MFQAKITPSRTVITIEDVSEVIRQLGEPEQIGGSDEGEQTHTHTHTGYEQAQRRLYRDPEDKMIAGVSGGLGYYFNVEPVWIRVAFIVTTFFWGFGPLVYLVLWIVVPKARSTAEKLEMKGEKVNISNIEKTIREELGDLKQNIKNFSDETSEKLKKKGKRFRNRTELSDVAAALVTIIIKVVGVFLVFFALILLVAFISSLFWVPFTFHGDQGLFHFSIAEFLSSFLSNPQFVQLAILGIILLVGIPIFMILVAGIKLLFGIEGKNRYLGIFAFVLWLAGLGIVAFMGVQAGRNFSDHQIITEEHTLPLSGWSNIYLELTSTPDAERPFRHSRTSHRYQSASSSGSSFRYHTLNEAKGTPRLVIRRTGDDYPSLVIKKESRGMNFPEANHNTSNIEYSFNQKDSLLILNPYFFYEKEDGWRNQKLTLELYIPENKTVVMNHKFKRYLDVSWNRDVAVRELR
jgi:phage shock protein PspC (stress-responsive transcriptional regulator)